MFPQPVGMELDYSGGTVSQTCFHVILAAAAVVTVCVSPSFVIHLLLRVGGRRLKFSFSVGGLDHRE
jgi:hypothetical protein